MFKARTGWIAVLVTLVGALTATDVMPLISGLLEDTIGPEAAHTIGALLVLVGVIVARFSDPRPPVAPPTAPPESPQ